MENNIFRSKKLSKIVGMLSKFNPFEIVLIKVVPESRIACQKNPNCNFWSYNPSLKHCLTFETFDVIEKSHQGYISGSRCCPTEHKVKPEYCQAPDSTTPKVGNKLSETLYVFKRKSK